MEFKKSSISFTDASHRFTDELAGFEELGDSVFSSEGEASTKVDAFFETEARRSEGKHLKEAKKIHKEMKTQVLKRDEMTTREEHFSENAQARISERKSYDNQMEKVDKKTLKKQQKREKKERKKAARRVAVANMFKERKRVNNALAGKEEDSGDAFEDGKRGLAGTILEYINPMHYIKSYLVKIGALIAPYVVMFMTCAIIVIIMVALVFNALQPVIKAKEVIDNIIGFFTGDGDSPEIDAYEYVDYEFSVQEMDDIAEGLDIDSTQEEVIYYALMSVGMPYSQERRTSEEAYDCSSLAYYCWKNAGIDIGFGSTDPPCAAEEARLLEANGKALDTSNPESVEVLPGDLIFYGNSDNGRYMGIYHVAIYIGNGKVVEALNDECGVVYQKIRSEDAVMICRPNL